jgi:hypothetical protein
MSNDLRIESDDDRHPRDAELKRWAAEHGMVLESVQKKPHGVLGVDQSTPDPFYVRDSDVEQAEWVKAQWDRFGFEGHVRRLHYAVFTAKDVLTPGGPKSEPHLYGTGAPNAYRNDNNMLKRAAKVARYRLDVDPEALEDRRNDALIENVWPRWTHEAPSIKTSDLDHERPWKLPLGPFGSLLMSAGGLGDPWWDLPVVEFTVSGYDYETVDQPVYLVLAIEKATDIVGPLCRRLGVDLLTGVGFESITRIVQLLRRAERLDRHLHVLYVSDCDRQGRAMPFMMARHFQFWAEELGVEHRLTIERVALTPEQLAAYEADGRRLPDNPDKPGQVELDALVVLLPGELERLIIEAVDRLRDLELSGRLDDAKAQVRGAIGSQWSSVIDGPRTELEELRQEVVQLQEGFRRRQRDIQEEARRRLGDLEQQQAQLAADYRQALADARLDELLGELWDKYRFMPEAVVEDVELPERPEPEQPDIDDDGLLFDSRECWLDSLARFKRAAHGNGSEPS